MNNFLCLWIVCVIRPSTSINFNCWDESEQQKLTYTNNPSKLIEGLPTVRLFQGFYGSQWAMQYTAYVYLREQLGVNVSWYPSDNHYILYNDSFDRPAYPHFYFHWLVDDKADLLFELWHNAMEIANADLYLDNGSVVDGGNLGVYGEMGWFIPQYLVDSMPNIIVPKNIKNNQTLRDMIIYAMVNGSDTDWIDEFYSFRSDVIIIDENGTINIDDYDYGLPTYDKPTIFGSIDSYAMSQYTYNQSIRMFATGMDWNFATFNSESKLTEYIVDMYSKRLPFIVNIYRYTK